MGVFKGELVVNLTLVDAVDLKGSAKTDLTNPDGVRDLLIASRDLPGTVDTIGTACILGWG
jgi:hypothetical protein